MIIVSICSPCFALTLSRNFWNGQRGKFPLETPACFGDMGQLRGYRNGLQDTGPAPRPMHIPEPRSFYDNISLGAPAEVFF